MASRSGRSREAAGSGSFVARLRFADGLAKRRPLVDQPQQLGIEGIDFTSEVGQGTHKTIPRLSWAIYARARLSTSTNEYM